jgi:hypothetical protein
MIRSSFKEEVIPQPTEEDMALFSPPHHLHPPYKTLELKLCILILKPDIPMKGEQKSRGREAPLPEEVKP